MVKRTSLGANISAPDKAKKAAESAKVARSITGQVPPPTAPADDVVYETVSYNLPLDLIDLARDLARERHVRDQAAKREQRARLKAAKKAGLPPPIEAPEQARQSASAVIREALEAHRDAMQAELDSLRG